MDETLFHGCSDGRGSAVKMRSFLADLTILYEGDYPALPIKGPALIWFNNLTVKDSWTTVKAAFVNEYCSMLNNPSLIAESVAFDNLKLNPTQAIEDFHSVVRRLNAIMFYVHFFKKMSFMYHWN